MYLGEYFNDIFVDAQNEIIDLERPDFRNQQLSRLVSQKYVNNPGHLSNVFLKLRPIFKKIMEDRSLSKEMITHELKSDSEEIGFLRHCSAPNPSTLMGWDFLFELAVKVQNKSMLLSKDDRIFTLVENSFSREWAFHVPIFKASSISGLFRNALLDLYDKNLADEIMGQAGEVNKPICGDLHFFPMIFSKTRLDLFIHLDEERRYPPKGAGPIHIEGVPEEEESIFYLGYFPIKIDLKKEVALEKFKYVCQGINHLVNILGLGAKRSSDFGNLKFGENRTLFIGNNYSDCIDAVKDNCQDLHLKKICLIEQ